MTDTRFSQLWQELVKEEGGKIVYLVMDGLGGLPNEKGQSELQTASTPNLDRAVKDAACGLLEMVGPGITPGSGPGHLALFGYEPWLYPIGRGVLAALGIDFELREGDVAARANFASLDQDGKISDRRAGRIATETNERLCEKIREGVRSDFDGRLFLEPVREHRALLVLRGKDLSGELEDTDPQATKVPARDPMPRTEEARKTADVLRSLLREINRVLADEENANTILLRGFDQYKPVPSIEERYKLHGLCVADYPMYRGLCRLLGFEVPAFPGGLQERVAFLTEHFHDDHDLYFLHVKSTDSAGEDADFDAKVAAIEVVDRVLPQVMDLEPDVLVLTGDHSTPAVMGAHSWHPVPVMLRSPYTRRTGPDRFDEIACLRGFIGLRPATHLMGLSLAHAGRLRKYGA